MSAGMDNSLESTFLFVHVVQVTEENCAIIIMKQKGNNLIFLAVQLSAAQWENKIKVQMLVSL